MAFSFWNVTIYDLKQDGTANLSAVIGKQYNLEVYVIPLPESIGNISNHFIIYNVYTGENYSSEMLVPASGGQYTTVHMANISRVDGWGIKYYKTGDLRTLEHFDTADYNEYFNFEETLCVPDWQCEVDIDGKNTGYKIDINGCLETTYDNIMCPVGEEPTEPNNIIFYGTLGLAALIGLKLLSKK